MRQRLFVIAIFAVMCIIQSPAAVHADTEVDINATFSDAVFREYVKAFDTSNDGKLSDTEIAAVTEINVSDQAIASLEGIKTFTSLNKLECSRCQLTSLDVSGMTSLKELKCSVNYNHALYNGGAGTLEYTLTGLDVTGCTGLETLYCSSGKLTGLDVSGCANLKELNCSNNELTALNVSSNGNLTVLNCSGNNLIGLSVNGLTKLTELSCQQMDTLTSLEITGCSALGALHCRKTNISALDVSGCSALSVLNCSETLISSLDISSNPKLVSLTCQKTPLTSVGLNDRLLNAYAKATKQYDSGENREVYILDEPYAFLSVPKDCNFYLPLSEATFPDAKFRNIVKEKFNNDSEENKLSGNELNSLLECTELIIEGRGVDDRIADLIGIKNFVSLKWLNCMVNNLTSLDVSDMTSLKILQCTANQLTSLDISGCTNLAQLSCQKNQLEELDVSDNKKLIEIQCSENELKEFDGTQLKNLEGLSIYGNEELSSLKIEDCTVLKSLDCRNTAITELDVSIFPELSSLLIKGSLIETVELNDNLTQAVVSGTCTSNAGENTDKYVLNTGENQFMLVVTLGFEFLYNVSVSEDITGGTVTVDKTEDVEGGDAVKVTAVPKDGYELSEIVVFDKHGRVYGSLDTETGVFTMPYCNVTVSAVFSPIEGTGEPSKPAPDDPEAGSGDPKGGSDDPDTGDSGSFGSWVWMMLISAGMALLLIRKRTYNR